MKSDKSAVAFRTDCPRSTVKAVLTLFSSFVSRSASVAVACKYLDVANSAPAFSILETSAANSFIPLPVKASWPAMPRTFGKSLAILWLVPSVLSASAFSKPGSPNVAIAASPDEKPISRSLPAISSVGFVRAVIMPPSCVIASEVLTPFTVIADSAPAVSSSEIPNCAARGPIRPNVGPNSLAVIRPERIASNKTPAALPVSSVDKPNDLTAALRRLTLFAVVLLVARAKRFASARNWVASAASLMPLLRV